MALVAPWKDNCLKPFVVSENLTGKAALRMAPSSAESRRSVS